ncbi:hypothetical protein RCS94_07705 [Orbaceae bacterium ac157xtp]
MYPKMECKSSVACSAIDMFGVFFLFFAVYPYTSFIFVIVFAMVDVDNLQHCLSKSIKE